MNLVDTPIPIYRRPLPPTAEDIIAKLRYYGWTDDMMTPDMRACIEEIVAALGQD